MKAGELRPLEQALAYQFSRSELIIEALTHRSHHHEHGDSRHNERLEFLGDAVLDLCVTELVMEMSPTTSEGHLSKLRSQLVSESSLATAARRIELGRFVRLGRGEDQSGGRTRDALLADTLEAVLAAVYIDGGLEPVRKIIRQIFQVSTEDLVSWEKNSSTLLTQDFKSRLQELCQSWGLGTPTYTCTDCCGPDHSRRFTMALLIQDREVIRAEGFTKKEATQRAAQSVLTQESSLEGLLAFFQSLGLQPRLRRSSPRPTSPDLEAKT